MPKSSFIYVVGPTATGKTQVSVEIAKSLGWPIINCDSVQVFNRTLIGTAQPTSEERSGVPHHLFAYVDPPKTLTVADYLEDVTQTLQSNKIQQALFTGGSGFYIQALQKGLYPQAEPSDEVKEQVERLWQAQGAQGCYDQVAAKDPEFAKGISPNDHYRVRRAMEVMLSQNRTMTELKRLLHQEDHSVLPPHHCVKLGMNCERQKLRPRIEERTQKMLDSGWIQEVEQLRKEGFHQWSPMLSVGYKEVQSFLEGEISEAELPEKIVTATMQLVKKQQTWFKRDPGIQWFEPDQWELAVEWALNQVSTLD